MADDLKKAERLLLGAYALRSAKDNIEYYRDFAPIYDDQFAGRMGYSYPAALANVYNKFKKDTDDFPIADIGCGTGLVAKALALPAAQIDGIDISDDMLDVARAKSIYRECYQIDLKSGIEGLPCDYGAVVSAGTFTFGHLGPETLTPLLDIARNGALFCIGINAQHFENEGFARVFSQLSVEGRISKPVYTQQEIYSANTSEHAGDDATVVVYRKV